MSGQFATTKSQIATFGDFALTLCVARRMKPDLESFLCFKHKNVDITFNLNFVNIQYELYTYATLRLPSRSCSNGSQPLSFVEVLALVPGVSFSQLAQNVLHRSLRILGVAGTKNLEAYGGTVSQNMKTDGTGTPKQSCLSHLFRLMFTESYVSDSSY